MIKRLFRKFFPQKQIPAFMRFFGPTEKFRGRARTLDYQTAYNETEVIGLPGAGVSAQTVGTFSIQSNANGLVALAGGGQTGATPITTKIARFTTVATAGDSALLPASRAGLSLTIINGTATSMNIFPATGDAINALAANAAFALAAGKAALFTCAVAGTWNVVLSA